MNEKGYVFKTILGDKPMYNGYNYWEIQLDYRTEIPIKIGVTSRTNFNMNTSFSDSKFGFSFFGQGSLRNASSKSGMKYGTPFKNEGVIGVFLDMNSGTLSFAKDGEYFGVAFKSDELK